MDKLYMTNNFDRSNNLHAVNEKLKIQLYRNTLPNGWWIVVGIDKQNEVVVLEEQLNSGGYWWQDITKTDSAVKYLKEALLDQHYYRAGVGRRINV